MPTKTKKTKKTKSFPESLKRHPLGVDPIQRAIKDALTLNQLADGKAAKQAFFRERHAKLAAKIINAEPFLIGGVAVCQSAGHCAGAALLFAVGTPNKYLSGYFANDETPRAYHKRLFDALRIDRSILDTIIHANDKNQNEDVTEEDAETGDTIVLEVPVSTLKERRKNVIETIYDYVDQIVDRPDY